MCEKKEKGVKMHEKRRAVKALVPEIEE